MSADNWGECPQCKLTATLKAESAYGKVSEAEYLDLMKNKKEVESESSLREDYEIGTNPDGEFTISYRCSCDKCGFNFKYRHSQYLPMNLTRTT